MTPAPIVDHILSARYLREGERTFADICHRVADAVAGDRNEAAEFYDVMVSLRFLPNSPTLMNAGIHQGQLSACFVLPVPDSIDGIFEAMKNGAIIHKTGGGTGYNFSQIRPKGTPVQEADGVASGPVSFMGIFNAATDVIKQGGRRRGANMGILNVTHPDILSFIAAKGQEGTLANFNISVMVSDRFMDLVHRGEFSTAWITPSATSEPVTVGEIWSAIVEGIWKNGEPGLLFQDEINRHNPTPALGRIEATNPCGEQPLLPFESCVLGSINLARFIQNQAMDEEDLEAVVRTAVRFLDSVIDRNYYPVPEIEKATLKTRKIGLGVMGVHDALLMTARPYDSVEGRAWCRETMRFITDIAVDESRIRAGQLGPFPAWDESTWSVPVRNATLTSIAPTGTISILAGCSSSIEPLYSFAYTRRNTAGETFVIVNPVFRAMLEEYLSGLGITEERQEILAAETVAHAHGTGTIQDLDWIEGKFRALFKTALDIGWNDHIMMQAAFQQHVHASISKTVNMPEYATRQDCARALLMAWKLNLKGITLYRSGSRKSAVLTLSGAAPGGREDSCGLDRSPAGDRPSPCQTAHHGP